MNAGVTVKVAQKGRGQVEFVTRCECHPGWEGRFVVTDDVQGQARVVRVRSTAEALHEKAGA